MRLNYDSICTAETHQKTDKTPRPLWYGDVRSYTVHETGGVSTVIVPTDILWREKHSQER